ncbi:crossover junction endonuclease EME1-like [Scleropages formosus]|uniref:Crossover junction endonuclease EME1-like n=1 Tax=Scleropages formosus TaxID=113540 RepID=A0A0P7XTY0_SCLFO|nr:crossover junction endonuclease EME1-like [Scleropages formosus]
MGGSLEEDQSTSSSDLEDLPSYGFLRAGCSQSNGIQRKPADVMVIDSLDFEAPSLLPAAAAAVGGGGQKDIMMVSSESEEEEVYVPLAVRLRRHLGGSTTSSPILEPGQTLQTFAGQPSTSALQHQHNSSSELVVQGFGLFMETTTSSPKKKAAKRTMAEIKAHREDALKTRVNKETHRLELERQRAEKKALTDAAKAIRPKECIKHMVVSVDPGRCLLNGTPSKLRAGEEHRALQSHAVIHVPVNDFISMVHNYNQEQRGVAVDCGQTLTGWTCLLLAQSTGHNPSLAVIDIEKYFRSQKSQNQRKYREAVQGNDLTAASGKGKKKKKEGCEKLPDVSRVAVEEAWGQRVDRNGKGLLQVWKRQIQQLNRVSLDMASAIVTAYPSPQLLTEAYGRCRSDREKALLLSDLLIRRGEGVTSTTRRIGPELSKRLSWLMTSSNPEQVLDSMS